MNKNIQQRLINHNLHCIHKDPKPQLEKQSHKSKGRKRSKATTSQASGENTHLQEFHKDQAVQPVKIQRERQGNFLSSCNISHLKIKIIS